MTILAITDEHLVEFECNMLWICRYSDGHCVTLKGKGIAGQFRADLKAHGAEKATGTFLRMCRQEWEPVYKAHCMPRTIEAEI